MQVSIGVQAGLFTEMAHGLVIKDRDFLHNVRLVHGGCYVPLGGAVGGGGGQVYCTEVQVGQSVGVHWEGQGGVNAPSRASQGKEDGKKGHHLFEHPRLVCFEAQIDREIINTHRSVELRRVMLMCSSSARS